jgi:hypothetical protein
MNWRSRIRHELEFHEARNGGSPPLQPPVPPQSASTNFDTLGTASSPKRALASAS